jgi:hypothetical protein
MNADDFRDDMLAFLFLHGAKDSEFEIHHGGSLTNDSRLLRETNPAKVPRFDAVVANPPSSRPRSIAQRFLTEGPRTVTVRGRSGVGGPGRPQAASPVRRKGANGPVAG